MKKSIILSLVLAFAVSLSAQEKKVVEFTETTHDFGTVQEGTGANSQLPAVFTFRNVGTTPIFIQDIRTGCGCTKSQVDTNKPILPGETGNFTLYYDSKRKGGISRRVEVIFKDGGGDTFSEFVNLRGNVVAKAQEQPQQ